MDRTKDEPEKKNKVEKKEEEETVKQHYLIETPTNSFIDVEAQERNKNTYKLVDKIIAGLCVVLAIAAFYFIFG